MVHVIDFAVDSSKDYGAVNRLIENDELGHKFELNEFMDASEEQRFADFVLGEGLENDDFVVVIESAVESPLNNGAFIWCRKHLKLKAVVALGF